MTRSAHGLVPNHPIFQGPFPVEINYATVPTPDNYRRYIDGIDLPAELAVWHVDTTDFKTDELLKPGTVSTGWGFADSPDAEVIALGINTSKGPSAVALGRHGSLFLWGFACEPGRMTPSGRNAFLNAISYIRKFDHAPRLVEGAARDRRWALQRAMDDPEQLAQARRDLEFLRAEGREYVVDEDCKALGISNRDVALLDHCVSALERGEDVERSLRLLERYTGLGHETASEWREWLSAARANLFFSDIGGYRFFEAKDGGGANSAPAADRRGDHPVTISASVEPARAAPGDIVTVAVQLSHAPGWHTYVSTPADSPYDATRLSIELPAGWSTVGRWSEPPSEPMPGEPGVRIATGETVFLQRVRVGAGGVSGETRLKTWIGYVVCDAERCLPPEDAEVTVTLSRL